MNPQTIAIALAVRAVVALIASDRAPALVAAPAGKSFPFSMKKTV